MKNGIGKKIRKAILQKPVRVGDEKKGLVTEYESVATVWAEVNYLKVRSSSNAEFVELLHAQVFIWLRTDVAKGWRIVVDGKTFGIKSTTPEPDDINLGLLCAEVVA